MSKIALKGGATGTATFTLEAPETSTNRTLTLPDGAGTVLVGAAPTASSTNTVTNKVAVVINGTTYYLLASTSGT